MLVKLYQKAQDKHGLLQREALKYGRTSRVTVS